MEKRIEVCNLKVKELKFDFGNPRKITAKKRDELRQSLEQNGDFGIFVIDESNNVIAGNQRAQILLEMNPDTEVVCKRMIGYSVNELKAINIKDNTHAGEWDMDILAEWTSDLVIDLGLDLEGDKKEKDPSDREIDGMELIHYEKYDYVMIVCKDELSYNSLVRILGIEDKKTLIGPKKRPIKARAIWYDDMNVDFVPKGRAE